MGSEDSDNEYCYVHEVKLSECSPSTSHRDPYTCLYNICREWLDECRREHSVCGDSDAEPDAEPDAESDARRCDADTPLQRLRSIIPTRLIDVGCTAPDQRPRLVKFKDREHLLSQTGARYPGYATLSYCWGEDPERTHLLRRSNEDDYCRELPPLPKTLEEAILLCRRVGVGYLWIDSLCIIQSDEIATSVRENTSDWLAESPRVGSYYANSLFTIAAAGSKDNHSGCFSFINNSAKGHGSGELNSEERMWLDSIRNHSRRRKVEAFFRARSHQETLIGAPLLKRAWVAQELSLTQRILWLSRMGVCWTCRHHCRGQMWRMPPSFLPLAGTNLKDIRQPIKWHHILMRYSAMSLSVPGDRLPAISGLCKYADITDDDEYCAGLWKSNIFDDLSWWAFPAFRGAKLPSPIGPEVQIDREQTSLPSWSPLSLRGPIPYPMGLMSPCPHECLLCNKGGLELIQVNISLASADKHGSIRKARLEISAPVYHVSIIAKHMMSRDIQLGFVSDRESLGTPRAPADVACICGSLVVDSIRSSYAGRWQTKAILTSHAFSPETGTCEVFLMLIKEAEMPNTYRRIGAFHASLRDTESDRLGPKISSLCLYGICKQIVII